MDTNSRKNRGEKIMEYTIRKILENNKISFKEQIHLKDIPNLNVNNKKVKRVNFIFELNGLTYLIESSFYNVGGSKISETCNSFVDFTSKLNDKFKIS